MSKNTSISLGQYFDQFVKEQVSAGRYKNISEVIRAGLRLLESEESKRIALKNAIQEGTDSGIAHDFDPRKNLKALKAVSQLPSEKVREINDFAEYILKKYEEEAIQKGAEHLMSESKTFAFLEEEEELYGQDDLKERFK